MNLHKAAAGLAHSAPEILVHPEVAKAMEQELVRTMVACLTAAGMADGSRSCRHGSAIMRRFEQVLEANEDEPLYIPEICAQIGVTDRMLRLYCQEHLGMGPYRYLWLRRMHLARRTLALADARARAVTEIANDYGFGELGLCGGVSEVIWGIALRDAAPDVRCSAQSPRPRIGSSFPKLRR
jgi:AraC-like DNA-binding protein